MNTKVLGIIIVAIVIIVGGFWLASNNAAAPETPANVTENNNPAVTPNDSTPTNSEVKTFNVGAGNFKFTMDEIRVNRGDTVRIVFTNNEGFHDWKIDEFNAATAVLKTGESETIEFVASEAGTFEYYCSVGTHRQMGMRGNLIVE